MSVVVIEPETFVAVSEFVLGDNELRSAFTGKRYLHARMVWGQNFDEADWFKGAVGQFFNRLYIANQLADAISYCTKSTFKVNQLTEEDRNAGLRTLLVLNQKDVYSLLRWIDYNLSANSGSRFVGADDEAILGSLRRILANRLIEGLAGVDAA